MGLLSGTGEIFNKRPMAKNWIESLYGGIWSGFPLLLLLFLVKCLYIVNTPFSDYLFFIGPLSSASKNNSWSLTGKNTWEKTSTNRAQGCLKFISLKLKCKTNKAKYDPCTRTRLTYRIMFFLWENQVYRKLISFVLKNSKHIPSKRVREKISR